MFDLGSIGDLLGGAGDVMQDSMASIEEVVPVDGVTDVVSGATDQITDMGSGVSDSISSILP
jgi:hypothetical protein